MKIQILVPISMMKTDSIILRIIKNFKQNKNFNLKMHKIKLCLQELH